MQGRKPGALAYEPSLGMKGQWSQGRKMQERGGERKEYIWMLEVLWIQRNRKLGGREREMGAGTAGEMGIQNV